MTIRLMTLFTVCLLACGGSQAGDSTPANQTTGAGADDATAVETERTRKTSDAGEFDVKERDKSSRPTQAKLKATDTEAAIRFFVVDKEKGPIQGIVISLTSPSGQKYYTAETDADGFTEVLVPIGKTYDLIYLSLGRRDTAAKVEVANDPRLNLKLTMRYRREEYAAAPIVPAGAETETEAEAEAEAEPEESEPAPRFVLDKVQFETSSAKLTKDSHARLDSVVEYMTYKKSARIEIAGHTDNQGRKKLNKQISLTRAEAVRDYLVSKGIDASRIETVGHGDAMPIAPNNTKEGRSKNRRIEAREL
jgi:outer membrane protein OmpA-like peptidoglycan-associated protein